MLGAILSRQSFAICVMLILAVSSCTVQSMDMFSVRLVENDGDRLIATSNYNYGISSPKLSSKNWRTAYVNGDTITAVTTGGQETVMSQASGQGDRVFLDNLRDQISNSGGSTQISSSGGGSVMMSTSSGMGPTGGVSFTSSSHSGGSSSSSSMGSNGGSMSVSMKSENDFSVSKSDLPYEWSKVYLKDDIVTFIAKNGNVEMRPVSSLDSAKKQALTKLKREVKTFNAGQKQQVANTMHGSMSMVSNMLGSIMGGLPKPPEFGSSVSGMFGSNFPFGPNNSPFSGGAFAFGGRR